MYLVTLLLEPCQLTLGIREELSVELIIAPLESSHPETIEVEHANGDVALLHALEEVVDGLLIVVGGERGGKPQPESPGRWERGATGDQGVPLDDSLGRGPVDDVHGHVLVGYGDVHASCAWM